MDNDTDGLSGAGFGGDSGLGGFGGLDGGMGDAASLAAAMGGYAGNFGDLSIGPAGYGGLAPGSMQAAMLAAQTGDFGSFGELATSNALGNLSDAGLSDAVSRQALAKFGLRAIAAPFGLLGTVGARIGQNMLDNNFYGRGTMQNMNTGLLGGLSNSIAGLAANPNATMDSDVLGGQANGNADGVQATPEPTAVASTIFNPGGSDWTQNARFQAIHGLLGTAPYGGSPVEIYQRTLNSLDRLPAPHA